MGAAALAAEEDRAGLAGGLRHGASVSVGRVVPAWSAEEARRSSRLESSPCGCSEARTAEVRARRPRSTTERHPFDLPWTSGILPAVRTSPVERATDRRLRGGLRASCPSRDRPTRTRWTAGILPAVRTSPVDRPTRARRGPRASCPSREHLAANARATSRVRASPRVRSAPSRPAAPRDAGLARAAPCRRIAAPRESSRAAAPTGTARRTQAGS